MAEPPRLLHARFPVRDQLLVDILVEWLASQPGARGTRRLRPRVEAVRRRDVDARCGRRLHRGGVVPPGSFIIEQGEPATELFCILSGSVDVVVEVGTAACTDGPRPASGGFVGEDGLFSGGRRNAHVIARDAVTCLVLAPQRPDPCCWSRRRGRGPGATGVDARLAAEVTAEPGTGSPSTSEHAGAKGGSTCGPPLAVRVRT